MTEDKVEFVKFGAKSHDTRTYALDSTGVVWISADAVDWESQEEVPRHIKQGLNAGQLLQLMARRGTKIV